MKLSSSLRILICCALCVPGVLLAQAPSTNASGTIRFAEPIFDFGKIRAGDVVKHTFVFTNIGPGVLNVTHVQPSCGCTAAADWTRTVEAGQTGSIPVSFNSVNFNGPVVKTISVTSSDKAQPSVVLQIKGTIWRPIEVSPQFAVINVSPDANGGSVAVRIINNTDEQVSFSQPEISNTNFTATIAPSTNNPAKEFIMTVTTVPPLPSGNVQSQITIKTTSTNAPVLTCTAWANVQPPYVVLPPQLTLPAPPLQSAISPSLLIQNNSTNALTITEPSINVDGVGLDLRETQPGRQFSVALTFPAGFELPKGRQILFTAKTSSSAMPFIRVPVAQQPPPITVPPAVPTASVNPPPAPAQPHQLPAVPR